MKIIDRVLAVLLIVGAALTAYYWYSYFTGGDVMVTHERWYTAFESSFPTPTGGWRCAWRSQAWDRGAAMLGADVRVCSRARR